MKRVILLSGGLDSATLLYDLMKESNDKVIAIFFDYGQRSVKQESRTAENIAREQGVELFKISLTSLFLFSTSSLIRSNDETIVKENRNGTHATIISNNTEVEFRNGVMLSAAISIVMQKFKNEKVKIYYGAIKTREPYMDCSMGFVDSFNALTKLCSNGRIEITAPYILKGKDEVFRLAKSLGVPTSKTWSCYDGGDMPCGKCPACLDRKIVEG